MTSRFDSRFFEEQVRSFHESQAQIQLVDYLIEVASKGNDLEFASSGGRGREMSVTVRCNDSQFLLVHAAGLIPVIAARLAKIKSDESGEVFRPYEDDSTFQCTVESRRVSLHLSFCNKPDCSKWIKLRQE